MCFSLVPYLKASYTELCMFLFKLMTFFHFHLFLCKLKTWSRNSTFYLICASNKHFLLRKPISIIMYEWWISHVYSFLYFSIFIILLMKSKIWNTNMYFVEQYIIQIQMRYSEQRSQFVLPLMHQPSFATTLTKVSTNEPKKSSLVQSKSFI